MTIGAMSLSSWRDYRQYLLKDIANKVRDALWENMLERRQNHQWACSLEIGPGVVATVYSDEAEAPQSLYIRQGIRPRAWSEQRVQFIEAPSVLCFLQTDHNPETRTAYYCLVTES